MALTPYARRLISSRRSGSTTSSSSGSRTIGKNPKTTITGRTITERYVEQRLQGTTSSYRTGSGGGSASSGGSLVTKENVEATGALKVNPDGSISIADTQKAGELAGSTTSGIEQIGIKTKDYNIFKTSTTGGSLTIGRYDNGRFTANKPLSEIKPITSGAFAVGEEQKKEILKQEALSAARKEGTIQANTSVGRLYNRFLDTTALGRRDMEAQANVGRNIYSGFDTRTQEQRRSDLLRPITTQERRNVQEDVILTGGIVATGLLSPYVLSGGVRGFSAALATGVAQSEVIGVGSQKISRAVATKRQRQLINTDEFIGGFRAAEEAQAREAARGGFDIPFTDYSFSPKALANEISLFFGNRGAFQRGAEDYLKGTGLSPQEQKEYAELIARERNVRGTTEIVQFLNLSRLSERVGSTGVARAFENIGNIPKNNAGWALAKKSFFPIFRAGVIEGGVSEFAQQRTRGRDINIKEIGAMGLLGGATAGIIGSTIVGTSVNRVGVSKTLQGVAYLTDPFEYAGDKLAGFQEAAIKAGGGKVITPSVTLSAQTETIGIGSSRKPSTPVNAFTSVNINQFTQTNVNEQVNTLSITPSISIPLDAETFSAKSNIFTNIGIPINTNTNTNINSIVPINTNTQTPVNTNINTPVNTNTNINIPVITPQLRVPPPILPQFDLGQGFGAGTAKRKKKKFINELELGRKLLGDLLL